LYLEGEPISYDILSLDVGSTTRGLEIPGVKEYALSTRPISDLLQKIEKFEESHSSFLKTPQVIVIGAGPAGVELAWAFRSRFEKKFGSVEVRIYRKLFIILEKLGYFGKCKTEYFIRVRKLGFKRCFL
jgi:NADH dehydrogenase FAD-containing subunit